MKIVRSVISVLAALVLAFAGMIGVELVSSRLHPLPPGFDINSFDAMCEHVARYPSGVLFLCAIGWWLTVLVSCWVATRLGTARHSAHGILVGLVLLGLAVMNMAMLPYPRWFWVNVIMFPASTLLGIWLARRRSPQR